FVKGEYEDSGTWELNERDLRNRFDQLADWIKSMVVPGAIYDVVMEVPSGGGYRMQFTYAVIFGRALGVVEGICRAAGANVWRVPVQAWKGNEPKGSTRKVVVWEL